MGKYWVTFPKKQKTKTQQIFYVLHDVQLFDWGGGLLWERI